MIQFSCLPNQKFILRNFSVKALSLILLLASSLTLQAQMVTSLAGRGPAENGDVSIATFKGPTGIAVDSKGNIYVAEEGNYKIRKITPEGVVSDFAGSGRSGLVDSTGDNASFWHINGIAIGPDDYLYVADDYNYCIRKVSPAGKVTTLAGSATGGYADGPAGTAKFYGVQGIAVDKNNNVYVSEWSNQRIRKISPDGLVSTLAGSGLNGSADGVGSSASFNLPTALVVDAEGNIYVADRGNNTIRMVTPAGVVSTFAGSGSVGATDWVGTAASFSAPNGLTIDETGNLYVAETGNHKIRKITPDGAVSTFAGNGYSRSGDGTGIEAEFAYPAFIALGTNGTLYVTENMSGVINNIRMITSSGVVTTLSSVSSGNDDGSGSLARFNFPTGLSIDSEDNIYVADSKNHKIRKITKAGLVTTFAGKQGGGNLDGTLTTGAFNEPKDVVVDASGNLYLSDSKNNKIRKITKDGTVTTFAGTGASGSTDGPGSTATFKSPTGLAIDGLGNLYVADIYNNKIRKITPDGVVSTFAGSGSTGSEDGTGIAASFNWPAGVVADANGNIYVADQNNHKIRKISPDGVVSTFAGIAKYGSFDGPISSATFYRPSDVAVDSEGNVYVADQSNHKIRKISPDGVVITLAGSGTVGCVDNLGKKAAFNVPTGIAVDKNGNVYVADQENNKIRVIQQLMKQNVTGLTDMNKMLGDLPFTISAVASSGLPVTYTTSDKYVASVEGNTVTIRGAGSVTILATQEGNDIYSPAITGAVLTIGKGTQSISGFGDMTKPFASFTRLSTLTDQGLTISYKSSNLDVATVSGSYITMTGLGTTTITAMQVGNVNYEAFEMKVTLTVTKGVQSISGFYNEIKYATDEPFELPALANSGLPVTYTSSDLNVATISDNIVTIKGSGTIKIKASQAGNDFYEPMKDTEITLYVFKVQQSITNIEDISRYMNEGLTFELNAQASSGLPITYSTASDNVMTFDGNTVTIKESGSAIVTATQAGNEIYSSVVRVFSITITKAPQTISGLEDMTKNIKDSDFELKAEASSGLEVTYTSSDHSVATIVGNIVSIQGSGSASITATQEGAGVYEPVSQTATLVVNDPTAIEDSFHSQCLVFDNGKSEIEVIGDYDRLDVYDLKGSLHYSGKHSAISVISGQLYFIHISKGETKSVERVMVR